MKRNLLYTLLFVLLLFSLTACQPISRSGRTTESVQSPTQPPPEPTTVPYQISLSPATTDSNPTAGAIFTQVSPSVAFIETPAGTGSGALIDNKFLLSNAHVVWPFEKVRVVFPDGSEHLDVPVYAWDLMADIALVGPIETDIKPVRLVDAGKVEIGSDVYLIGYPAEVDKFPQPSMTSGILSRVRTWDSLNYSFFQVDATITGGQSGGVLVTQQGDVVGISTFYYSSFGLAGNVADAIDRINALLGNDTGVEVDNRPFVKGDGLLEIQDTLLDKDDVQRYVLQASEGTEITLTVKGVGKPQISVQTLTGGYVDETQPDDPESQEAELTFTVEEKVPYLVEISQPSQNKNSFNLTSSYALLPYPDPDDRQELRVGDIYIGNLDTPSDTDIFSVTLKEGEVVEIALDTLSADPYLTVEYKSDTLEESVSDSDSGGGMFSQNAKIVYKAPKDDTYRLLVENYGYGGDVGGYFLSLRKADADAEVTEVTNSRKLIPSSFGKLTWYESEENGLAFLYPVEWQSVAASRCSPGATACFTGANGVLVVTEESLAQISKKDRNREGYLRLLADILSTNPAIDSVDTQPITTVQRLEADRLDFSTQKGRGKGARLIYVDEKKGVALSVTFGGEASVFDHSKGLIRMIFDSFRIWTSDDREQSAAYHLDEGTALTGGSEYDKALTEFNKALELDPELLQAYTKRAWVYQQQKKGEAALEDLNHAIKLAPQDESLYTQRSLLYWIQLDFEKALADVQQVIELTPEDLEPHNLAAMIYADLEQYDEALAEIAQYEELLDDDLPPGVLDTRAFIYLKMGDYENARKDYEAILAKDWRSPYPLLGAGIVFAHDGDLEQGRALIAEAMDKFSEDALDNPTPQLTDLLEMKKSVLDE